MSYEDFEKLVKVYNGRLSPVSYVMCYDIAGNPVFVPIKSSRHSHVIVVRAINDEDKSKVVGWAKDNGFSILEFCIAMPEG